MTLTNTRPTAAAPTNAGPLGRLGSWCYRRRRLVVVTWLVVLIFFSGLGRGVGSDFKESFSGGNTDSQRAQAFLRTHFPALAGDTAQVVFETATPITDAANRQRVTTTLDRLKGLPHVASVTSPFDPTSRQQISSDGHIAYGIVAFDQSGDRIPSPAIRQVVHQAGAGGGPGLTVQLGGMPIEKTENAKFGTSEGLGILAAIVILLLAFGSLIAMALPIATAIVAVAATFGLLDVLSHVMQVPSFGPELAALVGLGVGIDYALFVVTRYRNALRAGASPPEAVRTAMTTSGRAVVFAGSTVVLSLLGLFLLGLPFMYGAAVGTILAVLLVMAASITLLPAALGFAGTGIDRLHVGSRRARQPSRAGRFVPGFWERWARQVQRRPWVTGAAAVLVLILLALPFVSLRLGSADAGTEPTSYTTRQAFDLLAQGFGPGANGPLVVALELPTPATTSTVTALEQRLAAQPDVASVSAARYNQDATAAVVTVIPRTSPQDARTSSLVTHIRHVVIPEVTGATGVQALVGGQAATAIDTSGVISSHLAVVLTFVILLSLVLLVTAFRSVLIPLASAVLTLLSTGVAYGVVVAVFQWGWLGSGIDNGTTAPVDAWVPVMLFTILFGLSMDYQVFLVSRIREERVNGRSDSEAVVNGLASTGRVITSAAAIMICVFGAFVVGDLRVIRVFGFGMAVAILVDATLVRMVLMPSILQLFGRSSWWIPNSLGRILPNLLTEPAKGRREGATPEAGATP